MYNRGQQDSIERDLFLFSSEIEAQSNFNSILNQINTRHNVEQSNLITSKNILRLIAFSASSLSGVAYIPIARASVTNPVLGNILAGNVVFSFALGSSWGWQSIISQLDFDREEGHKILSKKNIVILALSVISGALTSIPSTYFAYTYNPENHSWVIFNYFDSLGLHSFGFNELYNYLLKQLIFCRDYRNNSIQYNEQALLINVKKEMEVLVKRMSMLIASDPVLYQRYLSTIESISNTGFSESEKCLSLLSKIYEMTTTGQSMPPELYGNGYPRFFVQIMGNALFPTAGILVNATLSYQAVSAVTGILGLQLAFVITATLAGGLIDYYTNNATYGRLFDNLYYFAQGSRYSNMLEQYYGKKYYMVVSCLLLSGIAATLTAVPSLYKTLLTATTLQPNLLLLLVVFALVGQCISKLYMSLDLSSDLMYFCLDRNGSEDTAKLRYNIDLLDQLAINLSRCKLSDFQAFVGHLSNQDIALNASETSNTTALQRYTVFRRSQERTMQIVTNNLHDNHSSMFRKDS